ncbi:nucleotidyltransferase [Bacillus sp. DJP31]|uniref:nucleotidyltransferase n=1 Tax=Bacillus sp. DJP31 TaxID=3409789 RepID=UPI003BB6E1D8
MKTAGVIVEYNPFHNGHLYHLKQTRKVTNADCIVAVMSGYFLQRGEPALVSKWARTKMALLAGVDLVIELPYAFSTQKAEIFANGSISILEGLGVDEVCFGSESGSLDPFIHTVQVMKDYETEFNSYLHIYLKEGNSFPTSASKAFQALSLKDDGVDLSQPNNILGFHYIKAIVDQQAKIIPKTIIRTGANYHDEHFQSPTIASATSIRKALFSSNKSIDDVRSFVPDTTFKELNQYMTDFRQLHHWEAYFQLLKYKVLTSSPEELKAIYEVEEGLEHRFISQIKDATSFNEFMIKVKTKRYTWTRLQRVCTHILTNTTKVSMKRVTSNNATYIRLLGMSQTGRAYLQQNKKEFTLPLISKLKQNSNEMLQLDIKASHTYGMIFDEPVRSDWHQLEYSTPPIQFDEKEKIFV